MYEKEDSKNTNLIDLTPNKDGGVLKEILREGEGDEHPVAESEVFVHYVGTLEDGSKFDSSRDRNEQFKFTLGEGMVIKAWDIGVASMKKKELCRLICKSEYAYGDNGSPPKIPPKATLIFEVELFEWKEEDLSPATDGGITRRVLTPGDGFATPTAGAEVEISLIGRANGTSFDERDLKFCLEEHDEHNMPKGVEIALKKFKKGEKPIIKLKSKHAFGSSGCPKFGVPPNSDVEYEIHLKDFEKEIEAWQMDAPQKLEQARLCKEKGTDFFKKENYANAVQQYNKSMKYSKEADSNEELKKLHLTVNLNLSMCYLKLSKYFEAKDHASTVLEEEPDNVKALFRRGQSFLGLKDAEEAAKDFSQCLKLDASNKAAAHQLHICQAKMKEYREKEKKMYSGMFDKLAK